jgi:hypothetical protein
MLRVHHAYSHHRYYQFHDASQNSILVCVKDIYDNGHCKSNFFSIHSVFIAFMIVQSTEFFPVA